MKPHNFTEIIDGWFLQVYVNAGPTYGMLVTYIKPPESRWAEKIAVNAVSSNGMDAAIEAGRKAIEKRRNR